MTHRPGPDEPTRADKRRVETARRVSTDAIASAQARYAATSLETFRKQIGTAVRSVSPFLVSLLASEGLSLDEVVEGIEPSNGWPIRPQLSKLLRPWGAGASALHHSTPVAGTFIWPTLSSLDGADLKLAGAILAKVCVLLHSVEVRVRFQTVTFSSCFGALRVELGKHLPETLGIAIIGRDIGTIVYHPSLRDTGWRVTAVVPSITGSVLLVDTGSLPYRMPWAR